MSSTATILSVLLLALSTHHIIAPPPPSAFVPSAVDTQALYNASDDVISLTTATFGDSVFKQEYATLVEFYNAFCGFCRRFAPHYKAFASDVAAWRSVVQVAAVDCANDLNSALCREYEIMGYPTMRFFGPHFVGGKQNYGRDLNKSDDTAVMRRNVVDLLRNETLELGKASKGHTIPKHWPQMLIDNGWPDVLPDERVLTDADLFTKSVSNSVLLNVVVYEPPESWLSYEVALDLVADRRVKVLRVHSPAVAATYGLQHTQAVAIVTRQLESVPLTLLRQPLDRSEVSGAVQRLMHERYGDSPKALRMPLTGVAVKADELLDDRKNWAHVAIAHVKRHPRTVFLADIEQALWYSLGHEVPLFADISGDRLEALKRYLSVLSK